MQKSYCDLSSTMEDYLETIYTLKESHGVARVGEIAKELQVKSPTVNAALKCLVEHALVTHEKYGYVTLTKEGEKVAVQVKNKHDILFKFLTEFLMLNPQEAGEEACRIEHAISKKTFERLVKFFDFLEDNIMAKRSKFLETFAIYLEKDIKEETKL